MHDRVAEFLRTQLRDHDIVRTESILPTALVFRGPRSQLGVIVAAIVVKIRLGKFRTEAFRARILLLFWEAPLLRQASVSNSPTVELDDETAKPVVCFGFELHLKFESAVETHGIEG